jgi:hypothetical protein
LGKASNIAVTDGDLNFAAVEDLGSGTKAGATIALRTRGRENTQSLAGDTTTTKATQYSEVGRDATVFVSGNWGRLTAGSVELGNGIVARGWGGTQVSLDKDVDNGAVLSSRAYANIAQYTSPSYNGLALVLTRADSIGTVGQSNASVVKVGGVTADNDRGVNANVVGLNYDNGPISASYDNAEFGKLSNTGAAYDRKRTRLSASYDFGMIKVGYGMEDNKGTSAVTGAYDGKQTTYGASMPVSAALRVGVIYAKNTEAATLADNNAKAKGLGLGADYALSKRTGVGFYYAKTQRDDVVDATKEGKQARLRLMHSF